MTDNAQPSVLWESVETGPCAVCGHAADFQCDVTGCGQWFCDAHGAIEAQSWDVYGWDGVDFRCRAHLSLSVDTRGLLRDQDLPAPRH
jgi:hypothetical protein